MAASASFRGLTVFINDIRQCQSKEQERARIDKELANIRTKFKSDKGLSSYEKKKYVWKLLYIYVLGYDVEFGHMEAIGLISSSKFAEKQVGYIATTVLLNENLEFVRLVINTIQKDLTSRDENFQCMALTAIANMGGREFAEALSGDVQKLLISSTSRPIVKKKAALCLLRLFRRNPDIMVAESWAGRMSNLLQERDLGVLLCAMSLLCGLVAADPTGYESVIPKVVQVIERLVRGHDVPRDYTYYGIASPWLHIKALRVLHYFPVIENDSILAKLVDILGKTVANTPIDKNVNKNNALHGILFETISLLMHLNVDSELLSQCVALLGKFVSVQEPNIRYLGLENMSRLSLVPEMMTAIKSHQAHITQSLQDEDISIRRRALDLLYGMCDAENSVEVVEELLSYLTTADFAIREELALKIAILSEKFASSLQWYIDVILSLIDKAGDHISDEVWYRVVQIVTNNEGLQHHAAQNVMRKLQDGNSHESMVKVASYILGEFGHLLQIPAMDIFKALKDPFSTVSAQAKGLILSAMAKLLSRYPQDGILANAVNEVFHRYGSTPDAELQQRAIEYMTLTKRKEASTVMAAMPKFPERESSLLKMMKSEDATAETTLPLERVRSGSGYRDHTVDALPAASVSQPSAAADLLGLDTLEGPVAPALPQANGGGMNGQADPLDLLSGLSVTSTEPVQQAAPPQVASSDPFGGFSDLTSALESTPAPSVVQPQLMGGTLDGWFSKLCVADKGLLYQDQFVQIGVKAECQRHESRIMLYIGNKHASDLNDILLSIPPIPSYRIQLGSVPKTISSQAQVQVPISISCLEASLEIPRLQLSYAVDGQPLKVSMKLPVIPSKSFMPVTNLDANSFFTQWKLVADAPLKQQQIEQTPFPVDINTLQTLLSSIRLGVIQGLDPNPNNLVGTAAFCCESAADALVMVRLEVDPSTRKQFRLTVASNNAIVTSTTKDLLLKHIKEDLN